MADSRSSDQKIRCFLAMAFDYADTDAVFRRMRSTLREIGVHLIRVDRIEHNDDIDERIISEIEKADFVLADLTYARPSVYFEAGYAQRSVPVVYTVRGDHFRARVDDPNGNLRVHFDLQMKNIIRWRNPNDLLFTKRLKARVSKIIAPIVASKRADTEAKQRASAFDGMAAQDKLEFLRKVARRYFSRLGYQVRELDFQEHNAPDSLAHYASSAFWRAIIAMKRDRGTFRLVLVHPVASVTKGLCESYRWAVDRELYSSEVFLRPRWTPRYVKEDFVICSLSGSNATRRLAKEIPYLRRGALPGSLACERRLSDRMLDSPGHQVRRELTIHLVESTTSLLNLDRELRDRIPQ